MINRREFLQATAIVGLPAMAGATGIVESPTAGIAFRGNFHSVLIDERHAAAHSVGTLLARAGAPVLSVPEGDITPIWLSRIGPAWQDQPVAIAGLTARPALFCLEQLAFNRGLRVVFHGEHIVHAEGRVEHSLMRGAEGANLSVRELSRAGAQWPERVAKALASHRHPVGSVRPGPSHAALEPELPERAQLLTSWIIAAV
jgi:hypothetical protein